MRDSGKDLPACSRNERTSERSGLPSESSEQTSFGYSEKEGAIPFMTGQALAHSWARGGGSTDFVRGGDDVSPLSKWKTPPSPISLPPNVLGINKK
jgi:hypothetical protein